MAIFAWVMYLPTLTARLTCPIGGSSDIFLVKKILRQRSDLEKMKGSHLILWTILYALSYSHDLWIPRTSFLGRQTPPPPVVLMQSCFMDHPAQPAGHGGGGSILLDTWLLLFSLEKRVALAPQSKEHFTKASICTQMQSTYPGPQIKGPCS